jgi:protein involved in polysaccharide export with SLBB domain
VYLAGCSQVPTVNELAEFDVAGPPTLVPSSLQQGDAAKIPVGPYRVVSGDLLQVWMPQVMKVLFPVRQDDFDVKPFQARVSEGGTIFLPSLGELHVAGRTLVQIEALVAESYYPKLLVPKLLVERPSVVIQVTDYWRTWVSVTGAVEKPGVYELRSNEMFLSAALMKAGGILKDGAQAVRMIRQGKNGQPEEVFLPIKGLNIPFENVALQGGETIQVERLDPQSFVVFGLVKKPGSFPYPPGAKYDLIYALGCAGGLDEVADPPYVKIYRRTSDGKTVIGKIRIDGENFVQLASVPLKPGDAVYVEPTTGTRLRTGVANFLSRTNLGFGAVYGLNK